MERRGYRSVIDPKVRQVGFVTPAEAQHDKEAGSTDKDAAPVPVVGAQLKDDAAPASPSAMLIPPAVRNAESPKAKPASPKAKPASPKVKSSAGEQVSRKEMPSIDVPTSLGSNTPESTPGGFATPSTPGRKGSSNPGQDQTTEEDVPRKPFKERTSKAERRALQEAQRASKAESKHSAAGKGGAQQPKSETEGHGGGSNSKDVKATKSAASKETPQRKSSISSEKSAESSTSKTQDKKKKNDIPPPRMQFDNEQQVAKAKKRALVEPTETKNRVELFRHLPQFDYGTMLPSLEMKYFSDDSSHPHPAIYKAGLQYLTGEVWGGNARCIVMLMAFRDMIKDYTTPPDKIFDRDLTSKIKNQVQFLTNCRSLSISMGNAIKFLKTRVVKLVGISSESDAKESLIGDINRYVFDKILYADKEIVRHAIEKIRDGDVCLTFGLSSVVQMIFLQAHERGTKFRVVVVDSRPKLEGKILLKRLLREGIDCTYTHLNGISYIMQEVTRVFLGAAGVLSNGTVYSRVGTATIAMVAHALSVPVMICCETYKFHERVQLDSITANELGDSDALVDVPGRPNLTELQGWADDKHLQLLNLLYDATPCDYVSMIITELGMVPPTSVPVILREYRRDSTI